MRPITPFSLQNKKIWIAGHTGMVGGAVLRYLRALEIPGAVLLTVGRHALDLRDQKAVLEWMAAHQPDVVILCAARVGGIKANQDYPADFLYDNLAIQTNVVNAAYRMGVQKLLFLGSSCVYPRRAPQPIPADALLSGPLEPTNEAYAVAKIAGLKLCQAYRAQHGCDFIAAMPCNLYGPGDHYDLNKSHVIPALLMRLAQGKKDNAPEISLWGSGGPMREFLYVDDLAVALVTLLERYSGAAPVNIGSGEEITIAALAKEATRVVGYQGRIMFDPAMPDGTPRKVLDSNVIRALGWEPQVGLSQGLAMAYKAHQDHRKTDIEEPHAA